MLEALFNFECLVSIYSGVTKRTLAFLFYKFNFGDCENDDIIALDLLIKFMCDKNILPKNAWQKITGNTIISTLSLFID